MLMIVKLVHTKHNTQAKHKDTLTFFSITLLSHTDHHFPILWWSSNDTLYYSTVNSRIIYWNDFSWSIIVIMIPFHILSCKVSPIFHVHFFFRSPHSLFPWLQSHTMAHNVIKLCKRIQFSPSLFDTTLICSQQTEWIMFHKLLLLWCITHYWREFISSTSKHFICKLQLTLPPPLAKYKSVYYYKKVILFKKILIVKYKL